MRGLVVAVGLVLSFGGTSVRTLAQCAMCGTALQGQDDPIRAAIGWSVAFLMLMPFTLFSSIGMWLYLAYRRTRAEQVAASLLPFNAGETGDLTVTVKEDIR
jgi:uncharacterized paraquat-inducible protein A